MTKFVSERDALLTALQSAGRAVDRFNPYITVTVQGANLTATGDDRDLTIATTAVVASTENGTVALPAKLTTDIVRAFEPGAVTIATDDSTAKITSGRAEFEVRVGAVPELTSIAVEGDPIPLDAATLGEGLRQVLPAALKDDTRAPQLTGVSFLRQDGGVQLAATDSYRLAIKDVEGLSVAAGEDQVIIPARALSEVQRLIGEDAVSIATDEHGARFVVGNTTITTRLLRGPFPDYLRLIPPAYPSTFTTNRAELINAIKRVRVMVGAKDTTPIRLSFAETSLTLNVSTVESGTGTEEIDGKLEGPEGLVAFNAFYLSDGLECATGDEASISFIDSSKPGTISSGDSSYRYLIMPVRVN